MTGCAALEPEQQCVRVSASGDRAQERVLLPLSQPVAEESLGRHKDNTTGSEFLSREG